MKTLKDECYIDIKVYTYAIFENLRGVLVL